MDLWNWRTRADSVESVGGVVIDSLVVGLIVGFAQILIGGVIIKELHDLRAIILGYRAEISDQGARIRNLEKRTA